MQKVICIPSRLFTIFGSKCMSITWFRLLVALVPHIKPIVISCFKIPFDYKISISMNSSSKIYAESCLYTMTSIYHVGFKRYVTFLISALFNMDANMAAIKTTMGKIFCIGNNMWNIKFKFPKKYFLQINVECECRRSCEYYVKTIRFKIYELWILRIIYCHIIV